MLSFDSGRQPWFWFDFFHCQVIVALCISQMVRLPHEIHLNLLVECFFLVSDFVVFHLHDFIQVQSLPSSWWLRSSWTVVLSEPKCPFGGVPHVFIVQWHCDELDTSTNVTLRKNHWVLPFLMLERPVGSQWTRWGSKNFQRCLKHVLSDSLDLELIRMLGHSAVVIREGECASSSAGDDPHGLPVPLRGEPSIKDLVGAQILVVDI